MSTSTSTEGSGSTSKLSEQPEVSSGAIAKVTQKAKERQEKMKTNAITFEGKTTSGIPKAVFIENIEEFLAKEPTPNNVRNTMMAIEEYYRKFKLMESSKVGSKKRLLLKIPEIEKNIEAVEYLIEKSKAEEAYQVQFPLSDNCYANAELKQPKTICLWLGANVMMEYSFEEGMEVLKSNLTTAKESLKIIEDELVFLREQITTVEVSTARLYNWDVKRKTLQSKAGADARDKAASNADDDVDDSKADEQSKDSKN